MGVGSEYCQAHNLTGPNLPIGGHCPFILIVAQDPVAKDTPASAELWGEVGQGRNEEASALLFILLTNFPKFHPPCSPTAQPSPHLSPGPLQWPPHGSPSLASSRIQK